MKVISRLIVASLLVLVCFSGMVAAYDLEAQLKKEKTGENIPATKPRLAIQDFSDRSGAGAPGSAITEMLTTELVNTGNYTIVEREKLYVSTQEQDLASGGYMDEDTTPERGKLKGAEFTVTGAITEYRYDSSAGVLPIPRFGGIAIGSHTATVMLDIRVVNNRTGEIILAVREKGSSNQSVGGIATRYGGFGGGKTGGILAGATYKVVQKIVEQINTVGLEKMRSAGHENKKNEVAAAKAFNLLSVDPKMTTATIDAGGNAGTRKGNYWAVYRVTGVVRGLNGEVLGEDKMFIALLQATDVQASYASCKVLKIAKNRTLKRGDKIQRVKSPADVVIN